MTSTPTVHRFPLTGPINLSVRLGHGSLTVKAVDDLAEAVVELIPDDGSTDLADRVTVEMSGPTLVVRAPRQGGVPDLVSRWRSAWTGAITAVITVPTGTAVRIATVTSSISTHGRCGGADVATGTGRIELDEIDGDLTMRYGSSRSSVTHVTGSVTVRSGSGDARFGDIGGDLVSGCGSGRLEADAVRGTVRARSGSGGARFGAVYGDVDVASGSGDMSIGLPAGISVRLDVTTGSGAVRTDLPITDRPAHPTGAISVRARTGSGDVRLHRSAA